MKASPMWDLLNECMVAEKFLCEVLASVSRAQEVAKLLCLAPLQTIIPVNAFDMLVVGNCNKKYSKVVTIRSKRGHLRASEYPTPVFYVNSVMPFKMIFMELLR